MNYFEPMPRPVVEFLDGLARMDCPPRTPSRYELVAYYPDGDVLAFEYAREADDIRLQSVEARNPSALQRELECLA
jgi:hypothetical protein